MGASTRKRPIKRTTLVGERLLIHKDNELVGVVTICGRKHGQTVVELEEHDGGSIYHESRKRLTDKPKSA